MTGLGGCGVGAVKPEPVVEGGAAWKSLKSSSMNDVLE
jgi:hypothetical protein